MVRATAAAKRAASSSSALRAASGANGLFFSMPTAASWKRSCDGILSCGSRAIIPAESSKYWPESAKMVSISLREPLTKTLAGGLAAFDNGSYVVRLQEDCLGRAAALGLETADAEHDAESLRLRRHVTVRRVAIVIRRQQQEFAALALVAARRADAHNLALPQVESRRAASAARR